MNKKIFFFASLLVFASLITVSCSLIGGVPGSGDIQTETRNTGSFETIAIEYPGAEIIVQRLSENPPTSEWLVMRLTILCHEDWARLDPAETAQFSPGAYLNYEDIRRLIQLPEEACDVVPQPSSSALYRTGSSSSIPVLLITNEADPQNSLENVADARDHYPNSLTVVAPAQGHGYTGLDCRDQFVSAFIETGTTKDLDTSCLQDVPLPEFHLSE